MMLVYDPRFEHDACGVAFVATLTGIAGHDIVDLGLAALATSSTAVPRARAESGDGAGLLVQVPDAFLREVAGFELPPRVASPSGCFLPDDDQAERATGPHRTARRRGAAHGAGLARRPHRAGTARCDRTIDRAAVPPAVRRRGPARDAGDRPDLARPGPRAFCLRKRAEQETPVYFPSLSSRTLV